MLRYTDSLNESLAISVLLLIRQGGIVEGRNQLKEEGWNLGKGFKLEPRERSE